MVKSKRELRMDGDRPRNEVLADLRVVNDVEIEVQVPFGRRAADSLRLDPLVRPGERHLRHAAVWTRGKVWRSRACFSAGRLRKCGWRPFGGACTYEWTLFRDSWPSTSSVRRRPRPPRMWPTSRPSERPETRELSFNSLEREPPPKIQPPGDNGSRRRTYACRPPNACAELGESRAFCGVSRRIPACLARISAHRGASRLLDVVRLDREREQRVLRPQRAVLLVEVVGERDEQIDQRLPRSSRGSSEMESRWP